MGKRLKYRTLALPEPPPTRHAICVREPTRDQGFEKEPLTPRTVGGPNWTPCVVQPHRLHVFRTDTETDEISEHESDKNPIAHKGKKPGHVHEPSSRHVDGLPRGTGWAQRVRSRSEPQENQAVHSSTFHVADKTSSRTRIRVYSIQFYIVVTRGEGGDGYTHDVPRPRDARAQSCRPTDDCRLSTEGSRTIIPHQEESGACRSQS